MPLDDWLSEKFRDANIEVKPAFDQEANVWTEIRLFLSSTFIDTHAERDVIIKRVIPSINRRLASRFIRITPVDLRWGVLAEESKDCAAIQKTCLNQLDKCRWNKNESPWFLGLRTARYGWVQDKIVPSEGFERPKYCKWLDEFLDYDKNLSITSLECIHATTPPDGIRNEPTIFFYRREIKNKEDIEKELKWVFDFENLPLDAEVDEEVKYQYARTDNADVYKEDKDNLDRYLTSLNYAKYTTYSCEYEKGGARFTCKNENRKSFGIGYVSKLEEFEKMVENDLIKSIESNFNETDISNIPEHVLKNIEHENAVRQRSATFVGRSEMYSTCLNHCNAKDTKNSVLVIHGEPGCGKSALLAAVSKQCLNELRDKGHFVFVHAVDSCPGSNNLVGMLRRLQTNLRRFRIDLGEDGIDENCPLNVADLKSEHVKFLEASAREHPSKKFVIFIDAVNQFHDNLQAWRMWWLPSEDAPKNLRFTISTLNNESGTFRNACEIAPYSIKLSVEEMSYEDREEMVTEVLKRYNKKLTTYDDSFLGNQMNSLLTKSDSPLYLIATTEALRRFGIFEKVSQYIVSLPNTIRELFSFLIGEWSEEYGTQFTQDVMGLLYVSRDGLLENEINDILSFKETEEGIMYDCSFSRLYDALSSFLAAGGGGFLRFFHDQLKYEVESKLLSSETKVELHKWLIKFFSSCIQPQLMEKPTELPPAYYEHCLEQIVYHQFQISQVSNVIADVTDTLRNIYFIRERVLHNQEEQLRQEYITTERNCPDENERKALKQWSKFTNLYSASIKKFPKCAYNMAMNQIPSSAVRKDTEKCEEVEVGETYPLYWSNIPSVEDPLAIKYTTENCACCASSDHTKNLCCIGTSTKALLYELDSGVLVHQVEARGDVSSLYLSNNFNTFWTGDTERNVIIWNCDSGMEEWNQELHGGDVIWIESIGDFVASGTGRKYGEIYGYITMINEESREITNSWPTGRKTHSYCYHKEQNVILSAHYAVIQSWSLNGENMKLIEYGNHVEYIVSITASPVDDKIAFLTMSTVDYNAFDYSCSIYQIHYENEDDLFEIETKKSDFVLYDHTGERLFTTGEQCKTTMVYGTDGTLQNKLKAHSTFIKSMCLIPDSQELLTAAGDGSVLFNLPTSPDENVGEESVEAGLIGWCDFLSGGENFASLNEDGKFEVWNTETLQPERCTNIAGGRWTAVHPISNYVVVYSYDSMYWLDTVTMETVSVVQVDDSPQVWIWDIQITKDGKTCLVATYQHGGMVFDIEDLNNITKRLTYHMEGDYMQTAHIHKDGIMAVTGGTGGLDVWDLTTGQKINTLYRHQVNYVLFLDNPDRVLYADTWGRVSIMDMSGETVMNLQSFVNNPPAIALLNNGRELMTGELYDNTLSVHNLETGGKEYAFVEHRSTLFNCLAVHPSNYVILAYNQNGIFYILKNTRD